jgi:hypothetical protein
MAEASDGEANPNRQIANTGDITFKAAINPGIIQNPFC